MSTRNRLSSPLQTAKRRSQALVTYDQTRIAFVRPHRVRLPFPLLEEKETIIATNATRFAAIHNRLTVERNVAALVAVDAFRHLRAVLSAPGFDHDARSEAANFLAAAAEALAGLPAVPSPEGVFSTPRWRLIIDPAAREATLTRKSDGAHVTWTGDYYPADTLTGQSAKAGGFDMVRYAIAALGSAPAQFLDVWAEQWAGLLADAPT